MLVAAVRRAPEHDDLAFDRHGQLALDVTRLVFHPGVEIRLRIDYLADIGQEPEGDVAAGLIPATQRRALIEADEIAVGKAPQRRTGAGVVYGDRRLGVLAARCDRREDRDRVPQRPQVVGQRALLAPIPVPDDVLEGLGEVVVNEDYGPPRRAGPPPDRRTKAAGFRYPDKLVTASGPERQGTAAGGNPPRQVRPFAGNGRAGHRGAQDVT